MLKPLYINVCTHSQTHVLYIYIYINTHTHTLITANVEMRDVMITSTRSLLD